MTVRHAARVMLWGAILLVLASGPAGASEIRLAIPATDLSMAPVFLARSLNLFAGRGLDVNLVVTEGSGLALKALLSRQVDFAFSPGDAVLLAFQRDPEIVMVYSGFTRPIINWAMNLETAEARGLVAGSPLAQKLKALGNLRLGVPHLGNTAHHLAEFALRQAGLKAEEGMRIVPIGSASVSWLRAVEGRTVDAALGVVPLAETAARQGNAMVFLNNAGGEDPSLRGFLMGTLVVRRDYLRAHPDTVAKMVQVMDRATRWALTNPPQKVADALQPFLGGMGPQQLLQGVEALQPALSHQGRVTEEAVEATEAVLEKVGLLKGKIPYPAVTTEQPPG